MSKAVLISIQPKWCELIARGKKTIEVRKARPKLETPFKCYIYMTKSNLTGDRKAYKDRMAGKVIGEFVCDRIENFKKFDYGIDALHRHIKLNACMGYDEIYNYLGLEKCGYGWHISNLKIYDKPKELSEFFTLCRSNGNADDRICRNCPYLCFDNDPIAGHTRWCGVYKRKPLTRPPQSWSYVEEL